MPIILSIWYEVGGLGTLPPFPVGVVRVCAHSTICARAVKRSGRNQEVIIFVSNACAGPDSIRDKIEMKDHVYSSGL